MEILAVILGKRQHFGKKESMAALQNPYEISGIIWNYIFTATIHVNYKGKQIECTDNIPNDIKIEMKSGRDMNCI